MSRSKLVPLPTERKLSPDQGTLGERLDDIDGSGDDWESRYPNLAICGACDGTGLGVSFRFCPSCRGTGGG